MDHGHGVAAQVKGGWEGWGGKDERAAHMQISGG